MEEEQNLQQPSEQATLQNQPPLAQTQPETEPPVQSSPESKSLSKGLATFLRFLVVAGGVFIVFVIGLGISFSACFTIKGPPPPECGPVSLVGLILLPGGSLFFLIPIARKIK